MAMDVGGAKGGLKADINVTPLVDVMLVLLIIMMLIAPMLQKGVRGHAAGGGQHRRRSRTRRTRRSSPSTRANQFYVNGARRSRRRTSPTRVKRALEDKTEKIVCIKGDKDAHYSAIMEAMDELRKAGSRTSA